MQVSFRSWSGRRRSTGFLGGLLFLVGGVAVLVFLAALAAVGLLVMALVGVVIGAERLLGLLVPAYRRRSSERYLGMPMGLIRMVRFGSAPTDVIDVRSYGQSRPELGRGDGLLTQSPGNWETRP